MERKTKFSMHLLRNGRHLFYDMELKQDDATHATADYRYGTFGSSGKSHYQFFHDDFDWEIEDPLQRRTALDKATEYITNKYYELWEKGYRDEGSLELTTAGEDGKSISCYPINAVGETYYMENKNMYDGERSFFQYTLRRYLDDDSDEYYVEVLEGTIGGNGRASGYSCATLEEALQQISQSVKSKYGYKKKPTPKTINCKIFRPFIVLSDYSDEEKDSDASSDDDDDSDDDKKKKKRKKKAAPAASKKTKKVVPKPTPAPVIEEVAEAAVDDSEPPSTPILASSSKPTAIERPSKRTKK